MSSNRIMCVHIVHKMKERRHQFATEMQAKERQRESTKMNEMSDERKNLRDACEIN